MKSEKSKRLYVVDALSRPEFKMDGCHVVLWVDLQENGTATVLAPKAFHDRITPIITPVSIEAGWLKCDGPARIISGDELKDFAWQVFVDHIFVLAGLPEVDEKRASGVRSNKEIAEQFRKDPEALYNLALQARNLEFPQVKRKFMSANAFSKQ